MPKPFVRLHATTIIGLVIAGSIALLEARTTNFHGAPDSAKQLKNPYQGDAKAAQIGRRLYARNCLSCHGRNAEGNGNIPGLVDGKLESVTPGELFWFITRGSEKDGMPPWAFLPARRRWQIVTYVKTLGSSHKAPSTPPTNQLAPGMGKLKDPLPTPPFTDFRYEKPGTRRKITVADLPAPYATRSAGNGPDIVSRPANAWPQAPAGFKVEQYATGLSNPRLLRTAPNGDIFVAESRAGRLRVFRGITSDGKPEEMGIFVDGLNQPYGIAFYPPGPDPKWIYVGNTNEVLRFAYHNGDLKATSQPKHIADLPGGGGHWTRDIQFSLDGTKMFVSVGSLSNIDDPDTHPAEKDRADILEFSPDGSGKRVYAYGIRNAGGGLALNPTTGELWCSVNERDALGDNLVPDYITHVQEGGFYGWPWWYIGPHQDPRHKGKHPELKNKVIVPDVLLQPHNGSLQLTFYQGKQFPAEYQGDILASQHGSWNKSTRVGYEVVRVPLNQTGHASGEYEDFLTGFVLPDGNVWGRPVGITVASDGSLLVSDDGSNSIWRISYVGR